jgi:hypothetical protein
MAAAGWAGWHWRVPLGQWAARTFAPVLPAAAREPQPDPARYRVLRKELANQRSYLSRQYQSATTRATRAAIEQQARRTLETALPEMMRCWLGTPWDFNGTAEAPGAGKIACGYFVATVLRDAGFRVDRYNLARQASGDILRSLLPKSASTLMVGKPYEAFMAAIAKCEPGIYVIGLDTHVGFLVVGGGSFHFIHSSGAKPWRVVDESGAEAGVIQRSNWREFGNLTADSALIGRWLAGTRIAVRGQH